jgi:dihydroxyacetone kinase
MFRSIVALSSSVSRNLNMIELGLLDHGDEGTTVLHIIGKHSPGHI